jgi:hypothetical protein
MGLLGNLFSGGAEKLIGTIGGVVDNLVTSKEEKEQLKIELAKEINRHNETTEAEITKRFEAELKDTADARNSNTRIQESDKASFWAKNTAYFLDIFIGLIWGSITIFLVAKALNLAESIHADMTAVLSIYSTVTAIFMICVTFHRGTSKGSQDKDKQISKMINQ